jgi:hypothetical protein
MSGGSLVAGALIVAVVVPVAHFVFDTSQSKNDARSCGVPAGEINAAFKTTGEGLVAFEVAGKKYVLSMNGGTATSQRALVTPCP